MDGSQVGNRQETIVVGPPVSRNQLLAYVLTASATCPAKVYNDVRELDGVIREHDAIVAIVDAQESEWIDYVIALQHVSDHLESFSMALCNVRRGSGTERRAFQLGVSGYFYSDDSVDTVVRGTRALWDGKTWISQEVLIACSQKSVGFHQQDGASLTSREAEVLGLLCDGASNAEIATELTISPHTVRTHLNNLFRKINVPNRLQAVRWGNRFLS
jgi:LuxR family transcriptional regulator of csgAB operon